MREFGYTCDQVCNMGYFEAHRLWSIADELKARDLNHFMYILDSSQAVEDYRKQVLGWLTSRQTRTQTSSVDIPKDVLDKFREAFNG